MATISQTIQTYYLRWKCLNCDQHFTKICFLIDKSALVYEMSQTNHDLSQRRWPNSMTQLNSLQTAKQRNLCTLVYTSRYLNFVYLKKDFLQALAGDLSCVSTRLGQWFSDWLCPGVTLTMPWHWIIFRTLQWRQYEGDGVPNHRRLDCLLNRLFRKASKLRATGLCEENPPVTGEFPS